MYKIPGTNISLLSKNRVLNCYTWSIPAGPQVCAGFNLEPGSTCHYCYAGQGRYRMTNVRRAQEARLKWWRDESYARRHLTLSAAIESATRRNPYFRIFESGDFSHEEDVYDWLAICESNPKIKFWASSRAWRSPDLSAALLELGKLPNVALRFSSPVVASKEQPKLPLPKHILYSTVSYSNPCPKQIHGSCVLGNCRACWDKNVQHVNYQLHGHTVNWKRR